MDRIYQVIVKAPINMNPGNELYRFMPGEIHSLPEHLGKEIFKEGSPYHTYFSLVDIVPPLEQVVRKPVLEQLLEAPDAAALNSLSTTVPAAPPETAPSLTDVLDTLKEEEGKPATTKSKAK